MWPNDMSLYTRNHSSNEGGEENPTEITDFEMGGYVWEAVIDCAKRRPFGIMRATSSIQNTSHFPSLPVICFWVFTKPRITKTRTQLEVWNNHYFRFSRHTGSLLQKPLCPGIKGQLPLALTPLSRETSRLHTLTSNLSYCYTSPGSQYWEPGQITEWHLYFSTSPRKSDPQAEVLHPWTTGPYQGFGFTLIVEVESKATRRIDAASALVIFWKFIFSELRSRFNTYHPKTECISILNSVARLKNVAVNAQIALNILTIIWSLKHLEHWFIMVTFSAYSPGISKSLRRASRFTNMW